MGALLGAGKRLITGESLFMTVFTNAGARQAARRVRGALPWQDPGDGSESARRRAGLPERLVPLCGARRVGRNCLSAENRRRPVRRRRVHHAAARRAMASASCTPVARSIRSSLAAGADAAGRYGVSRGPAAVGQLRHRVRRARSRRRSSAGKASSSRRSRGRARSGCSRCLSAGWPIASTRRRRQRAAAGGRVARFWAASAICSTAIHSDEAGPLRLTRPTNTFPCAQPLFS